MKKERKYVPSKRIKTILVSSFLILVFSLFVSQGAFCGDTMDARQLVEKARFTLDNFAGAQEMEAFRNLIKDARGVFIAPQVLRGAFIIGASGGSGVFLARESKGGPWAGPAFYTIGEVSFGFQAGGEASEIVLLVMTDRGVNAFLNSSVKLGADIGVAIGPVGGGAEASTANLSADIIAFARSKGLYGGISIEGSVIKVREGLNKGYYGKNVPPRTILIKRGVRNAHAVPLISTLASVSAGK